MIKSREDNSSCILRASLLARMQATVDDISPYLCRFMDVLCSDRKAARTTTPRCNGKPVAGSKTARTIACTHRALAIKEYPHEQRYPPTCPPVTRDRGLVSFPRSGHASLPIARTAPRLARARWQIGATQ